MDCKINYNGVSTDKYALTKQDSIQIINVLTLIRHGILRMHPVFKEKVDSSNNLGIVSLNFTKKKIKNMKLKLKLPVIVEEQVILNLIKLKIL